MYCIVDSTLSALACSGCTAPRQAYNKYCLCPTFQQETSSSACADTPKAFSHELYQALQGVLLVAFLAQFLLTALRVPTPFGWRAWGFLQACTAALALPAHKTYLSAGLLKSLYLSKGYYWLSQLYPGIELARNVNILISVVSTLVAFLLAYPILERFYSKGFIQYLKGSWAYLAVTWYLLAGN
jgi:hypothetical protein